MVYYNRAFVLHSFGEISTSIAYKSSITCSWKCCQIYGQHICISQSVIEHTAVVIVGYWYCLQCKLYLPCNIRAVRDGAAGAAMAAPLFQGPCAIGFAN